MLTFLCGLIALILAIVHGSGRGSQVPLWVPVALLGIGMMVPWIVTLTFR